ncbi:MAG: hypothetical protein R2747_03595 [Pyrinomonadaceae bacterium]
MKKVESANLILKLYELRREETMRKARNWFVRFFPETVDDVLQVYMDEESSAYLRMVLSYWDMAASFVNQGAIDEEMFNETNGEHIMVFSKIAPFLDELRERFQLPNMYLNLEKLIMRMPDSREMLNKRREMMKAWVEQRAKIARAG